ncbi:hypothetical protein [Virgibacillus salexigens]|uniref:hypothetical protein n=1 Tax=Virgibacillus salexigens TaxID=61016 RepID=UPI00190B3D44|nr:hypothetical protein [Virgibacillus salexigens]
MSTKSHQPYKSVRIYPEDFQEFKEIAFYQDKKIIEVISESLSLLKQKVNLDKEIDIHLTTKPSEIKKCIEGIELLIANQSANKNSNAIDLEDNDFYRKLKGLT